jgi:hypothetical protein
MRRSARHEAISRFKPDPSDIALTGLIYVEGAEPEWSFHARRAPD